MPDYKNRKIKLAPKKRANGLWQCSYTIIEFRPTCWAYQKGCPDGSFTSRQESATVALEEAKWIVDSLEPPAQFSVPGAREILGNCGNRTRTLMISFVRGVVYIGNIVPRSMFFLLNCRKIFNTTSVSASIRR